MVEKFCGLEELYAERAVTHPTPPHKQQCELCSADANSYLPCSTNEASQQYQRGKKRGPKEHDFVAETTVFKDPIYVVLRTIMREPY